jgi:hypothetical protein
MHQEAAEAQSPLRAGQELVYDRICVCFVTSPDTVPET